MTKVLEWRVLRPHEGDRMYQVGETRQGTKIDLAHLSPNTLELVEDDQPDEPDKEEQPKKSKRSKAETSAENKAEDASPANKSEPGQPAT